MDKIKNIVESYSLLGATALRDSTIAAKLWAAGVIILVKFNLSQWRNLRSNNSSNNWSTYGIWWRWDPPYRELIFPCSPPCAGRINDWEEG